MQADEYQSAEAGEEKPTRRGPPQDVDLVAQDKVLCCNRRSRSKQPIIADQISPARFRITQQYHQIHRHPLPG